jgi:serine O-acetyltransferase
MGIISTMKEDVRSVFARDPAATSTIEIVLLYPGLHAVWAYRFTHSLWKVKWRFPARMISEWARFFTGIEIHPGANIGRRLFIDHGMGVVIGETSDIGNDVLMYQGVVLGGTALEKAKRHPTIGNNVVIGAAAVLLGPITIGDGSRVGANSVVVRSVPPGVTVVGVPGRVVDNTRSETEALEHGKMPDPFAKVISLLVTEQSAIEQRVKKLEQAAGVGAPFAPEEEEGRQMELAHAATAFDEGGGI